MTNKITKHQISLLLLPAIFAVAVFGQTRPVAPVSAPLVGRTTLSSALGQTGQACLTSATGVNTPSLASGIVGSFIGVDNETIQVSAAGASSTCFIVKRGQLGSQTQAHASGTFAWIANASTSSGDTSRPFPSGLFGNNLNWNPSFLPTVATPPGTTDVTTAMVAGTHYWSEIEVIAPRPVLGVCVLNGATVGTDSFVMALYDFAGNLLANTALAGTATATASLYQCTAFVTPIEISGDRKYFVVYQSNGTTDRIARYVTGQVPPLFQAGSVTGTFGALKTPLAIPATFTTIKGPISALY